MTAAYVDVPKSIIQNIFLVVKEQIKNPALTLYGPYLCSLALTSEISFFFTLFCVAKSLQKKCHQDHQRKKGKELSKILTKEKGKSDTLHFQVTMLTSNMGRIESNIIKISNSQIKAFWHCYEKLVNCYACKGVKKGICCTLK